MFHQLQAPNLHQEVIATTLKLLPPPTSHSKFFNLTRQRLAQELTLQQFQHIRPPPPSPALSSIPLIAIVQAMLDLNEDQKKRQRRQILHVNIKKEETDDVTIKYLAVIVPKVITLLPSLYLPAVIHRSLPFIQIFNNNNNP